MDENNDYDSLGLIIPASIEEKEKILNYFRQSRKTKNNSYYEGYHDPQRLGRAKVDILETKTESGVTDSEGEFISFRSQNTGVYKKSSLEKIYQEEVSESEYEDVSGDEQLEQPEHLLPKTLEEYLQAAGFNFILVEAFSKWDDRMEIWQINTGGSEVSSVNINDIKHLSPAGYVNIEDIKEYYELNVLTEDYTDEEIAKMSPEEKTAAMLECFTTTTGYGEWCDEEITSAIQSLLIKQVSSVDAGAHTPYLSRGVSHTIGPNK